MAVGANVKAVIVHDAFVQAGGGERVAARLAVTLGGAPVFTAAIREGMVPAPLRAGDLRTSTLSSLVRRGLPLAAVAPLLPAVFARMDLGTPDVVVSSSSAFAHHVRVPAGTVHVCYCHTPPRFLWELDEYFYGQPSRRRLLAPGLVALRRLDLAASRGVDLYVANSRHIAARIERVYGRRALVAYPPVETRSFLPSTERSGRFLVVSRLRNHKRVDLAVAAANLLRQPLDIVGAGPELDTLRRAAGPTVRFLGPRSDGEVRHAMARCAGVLVPAPQDFGLTLVEAQASGRPPIAYADGGASEIVDDGRTGFLFRAATPEALAEAMLRAVHTPLETAALVRSAARFDVEVFRGAIDDAVGQALGVRATGEALGVRATGEARVARSRGAPSPLLVAGDHEGAIGAE